MSTEQKENAPSFRIRYFPAPGRAVSARLAAFLGGVAFEDEYVTQEMNKTEKESGSRRWGGIPEILILDKDGKTVQKIAQSNTCLTFAAKLSGLYPENPIEAALVEEQLDAVEEAVGQILGPLFTAKDEEEKKNNIAELVKEGGKVDFWCKAFVARLKENEDRGNKNGFLVGDKVGTADLKLITVLGYINSWVPGGDRKEGILSKPAYAPLLKVWDAVMNDEKVKEFNGLFEKNVEAFKAGKGGPFTYPGKSVFVTF